MDKEKVKTEVTEVKVLIDELIAENKLDGDSGRSMLNQFISGAISKEVNKDVTV